MESLSRIGGELLKSDCRSRRASFLSCSKIVGTWLQVLGGQYVKD